MAKIILRAGKIAIKIILPFVFIGLIFFSFKMLRLAKAVEEEPSVEQIDVLLEQAEQLKDMDQHSQAEQIYFDILEQNPGGDDGLTAQTELAILYIEWGKLAHAEAALAQLKSDFAAYPDVPIGVCRVAEAYFNIGQPERCKQLFDEAMNTWPNYEWHEEEAIYLLLIFASCCLETGQPQKALEIYRDIFDGQAVAKHAIEAIQLYESAKIELGDDPNVQSIVDKFIPRFLNETGSVHALHDIGMVFAAEGDNEKATEIYQKITDTWTAIPENTPDRSAWKEPLEIIVVLNLELGNEDRAQDVYDNLLASFSGNEDIVLNISNIAEVYHRKQQYQKVIAMCEEALTGWPDSPDTILAIGGIMIANIAIKDDPNIREAHKEYDQLVEDFANDSALPGVIVRTGGAYYKQGRWRAMEGDAEGEKAFYQVAISVWERLLAEFASPEATASAYYYSGVVYAQELGDYQKGIDYFQAAVDTLPDYEFGWAAHSLIARFTKKLRDSGAIAEPEANAMIKAAYEEVVNSYPDSRWVETALLELGRTSFDEGQFEDAIMYFEILLERSPEKVCLVGDDLSEAYDQMQDVEMAELVRAELAENNCPAM
jgi:tetratricopeptide (TPR) repeat protein